MQRTAHNRFVSIDITVPDFQVVAALRIGANPGLVMDSCSLAAEIGQRYQVSGVAFLTFGKIDLFHGSSSQPKLNENRLSIPHNLSC